MTMKESLSAPTNLRRHKYWSAWLSFHLSNRIVMREILTELEKAKQAGSKRASVKAIINFLRWNLYISSGEDYKINDAYTGIYTHMVWENFPEYRDMIEKRELRS